MNQFQRQAVHFRHDVARSCGALLGIVQGVLADGVINDTELLFLQDWLNNNENLAAQWPGNALVVALRQVLEDGRIDPSERAYMADMLQALVGGRLDELASSTHVSELAIDRVDAVEFAGRLFCLTGDFCLGSRAQCEEFIRKRGGDVKTSVTKGLDYLVVGGMGSEEWKHGSFGTKILKAQQYKAAGARISIVHEDAFAAALAA